MKRYGQVIRVKPERYEAYREYHRNVWPEIGAGPPDATFATRPSSTGMVFCSAISSTPATTTRRTWRSAASDPRNKAWWELMQPMQEPLESCAEGEWWADMEELVHTE